MSILVEKILGIKTKMSACTSQYDQTRRATPDRDDNRWNRQEHRRFKIDKIGKIESVLN